MNLIMERKGQDLCVWVSGQGCLSIPIPIMFHKKYVCGVGKRFWNQEKATPFFFFNTKCSFVFMSFFYENVIHSAALFC